MLKKMLFILLAALIAMASAGEARAQPGAQERPAVEKKECPEFGKPTLVNIVQYKGSMFQNQSKTAFDIAREKSVSYNMKMPLRAGNMGRAMMRVQTEVNLVSYPSAGCIVIEQISSRVMVDHEVEFAVEHQPGTCMYNELYNLEIELMQQDEEVVNTEVMKLREDLKRIINENNVYGPFTGIDFDAAKKEKKMELQLMIEKKVNDIAWKIFEERKKSDLPEFYEEIRQDCSGG